MSDKILSRPKFEAEIWHLRDANNPAPESTTMTLFDHDSALRDRIEKLEESIADACAESQIAGYYGENLESAVQCFRDKINEQYDSIREQDKRIEQQERALRRALQNGLHASNCARYNYAGAHCLACGIGKPHADGKACLVTEPKGHRWIIIPESPCDCYLEEVKRALSPSPEKPKPLNRELSSYAFCKYGNDAKLYNGIHDLETALGAKTPKQTEEV